ncbi:unnamed protein product [marine sediment metagenome]|uniref:Uncharacterized protein n=1 Tax=marine sediment metagenome TaxID=412755 RepID=X1AZC7_9ZZZZ
MAKKTTLETLLERQPRRLEFAEACPADTTTETLIDFDTGIDNGQGWVIYGMEWGFENIDPTVPFPALPRSDFFNASQFA